MGRQRGYWEWDGQVSGKKLDEIGDLGAVSHSAINREVS